MKKLNSLLARLNINELNINISELESCDTEAEALQKAINLINKKYLEINGAFIITDANGNFKYGNIFSENTPEFKNYKYKSIQPISGGYIVTFMNLETNTEELIEIGLDSQENIFLVKPKTQEIISNPPVLNVKELKLEILEKFNIPIINDNPKLLELTKKILNYYDENSNTINVESIELEINNAGLTKFVLRSILNTLQLDKLTNLSEEQKQDVCINPIKMQFK